MASSTLQPFNFSTLQPNSLVWKPGELQVHAIHTGRGEALFSIFPDATTMLLDCGDVSPRNNPNDDIVPAFPDASRSPGERIARYILDANPAPDPSWVDWLVISHYHSDHVGGRRGISAKRPAGLAAASRTLHFHHAIARGRPGRDAPRPEADGDGSLALWERCSRRLAKRDGLAVERFEVGRRDQIRLLHGGAKEFSIFNLCANGIVADERTGRVTDICGGLSSYSENAMSLGFIIRYGAFSLYTAGDFSGRVRDVGGSEVDLEERLAPFVPPVSAAKVNHHGHYTMPAALVAALRPRVWFGSVWTLRQFVPPVMERLSDRSLYPGDRTICPPFIPPDRIAEARAFGAAWLRDVPPEILASRTGGHIVLTVPHGGRTFDLEYRSATGETTFHQTLSTERTTP
jgi:glyoxylase-like metal-dependent hydrolase (beta-lactamase superfamily II)